MKQITLNIPEGKFQFFLELITSLGFVKIQDFEISDSQKEAVRARTKKTEADLDRILDWDEVENKFNVD
jgi:hypothetical protein